ncbi:MAG: hypothetical protein JNJ54_16040 [Myxococcaceae bacterium]|nr:hypothetical protein [Myxococcaceae bacterium]
MVEQRKPEALQAVAAVSEGLPLLLANGGNALCRTITAWDAPAIAVDPDTFNRLGGGPVQLFAPISTQAALELAAFPDVPVAGSSAAQGWLSEAWRDGVLLPAVQRAATTGERETLHDVVIRCSLGRPPAEAPPAEALERWENERRERQTEAMRVPAQQEAAAAPTTQHPNWARSLDELECSVRTANVLATMGLQTVGDLCQRTEADLLKMNGFSRQSLKEVKELLSELGLSLGMRA